MYEFLRINENIPREFDLSFLPSSSDSSAEDDTLTNRQTERTVGLCVVPAASLSQSVRLSATLTPKFLKHEVLQLPVINWNVNNSFNPDHVIELETIIRPSAGQAKARPGQASATERHTKHHKRVG